MILPKGITGFDRQVSVVDITLLERIQRELRQKAHCEIIQLLPPQQSNNYYNLELEYYSAITHKKSSLSLLINGYGRLWAMIETENSSWMNLSFIEPPKEIRTVLQAILQEVPLNTLQSPVDPSHLLDLGKGELKQVKYWESKTLGEIIFNGYD